MTILHDSHHSWYKPVCAQPEQLFGTKIQKRLTKALDKLDEHHITTTIQPLDETFLEWFIPAYEDMLDQKDNAVVHNIRAKTIENTTSPSTYFSLTLHEAGEVTGGVIFGVRSDRVMTAYKVFGHTWRTATFQISPAILAEYRLCVHAHELGKDWISHGTDRNPYGVNANIGLATFKLSVGYRPYRAESADRGITFAADETLPNTLLLHQPNADGYISNATLFLSPETDESKFAQLCSYPEQLRITILPVQPEN